MQAADAGWLLTAIARGGVVELPPDKADVLDALHAGGLVRTAPDPGADRSRMSALKKELERIALARAENRLTPDLAGRERGLRTAIVELSERLAESEGAAEIRRMTGEGPYRGAGMSELRWALTQRGRALLSDLAPRLLRVGNASLASFDGEMKALRDAFVWRSVRALEIGTKLQWPNALLAARRSVPLGLSAVRAPADRVAQAFDTTFVELSRSGAFRPEQDAAAAECLCLVSTDVSACLRPDTARWFHSLRTDLLARYAPGNPEDALDAAVLLAGVPHTQHAARIELASELAREIRSRNKMISLSLALLALAGEDSVPAHLPHTIVEAEAALAREIANPADRITTAVLLTFVRGDLRSQLEKWRTLRQYLARFAADGMAVAAALLSWLALEPAETLDNLRLASAALTKHRLAEGAAETMTHAIKLLLSMAALAVGSEGDVEERLALTPVAIPRVPQLGLSGTLTALPLATSAITAFHRTVLDAASEWERMFHPTHSSYVFGGGRGYGWG